MATLIVLTFNTTDGARPMAEVLDQGLALGTIAIADAATVVWLRGTPAPATCCMCHLGGPGRLSGPFWALFFGSVLQFPWMHESADVPGVFSQFGISNEFLKHLYARTVEGTSWLVLFSYEDITESVTVLAADLDLACEILMSQILPENVERLQHVFGIPAVQKPIFEPVSLVEFKAIEPELKTP